MARLLYYGHHRQVSASFTLCLLVLSTLALSYPAHAISQSDEKVDSSAFQKKAIEDPSPSSSSETTYEDLAAEMRSNTVEAQTTVTKDESAFNWKLWIITGEIALFFIAAAGFVWTTKRNRK